MAPHLSKGKTRSAVGIESAAGLAGLMRMSPVPFDGTWKLPWNQSGRQQDVPWAWRRVARTRPACIPVDYTADQFQEAIDHGPYFALT